MELVRDGEWQNTIRSDGGWSGALKNPGKTFFLELAAASVRDVNHERTKTSGLTFARKAMVRCGLACGRDGEWSTNQLSYELQEIIAKWPSHFNGEPVVAPVTDASTMTDQDREAFI